MDNNLDSMGVGKALELFPEQIKSAYEQALKSNIDIRDFDKIIISGMGGSSNAAKILQGLYEAELKIPLFTFNDYGLPAWVDQKTLVIANSYSGNTEETLSAVESAKKIGANVIGISTAGKINDLVIDPGDTNPPGFPKSGLGVSLGALMGVLVKLGVLPVTEDELKSSLNELVEIRKRWNAQELASWLNGSLAVLFGGRPQIGSLNAGRNAMCEISRNFVQFYDFPEMNHVLIEALAKPEIALQNKYLFFVSKFNHPRVLARYKITAKIFSEQGLTFNNYTLKGSTKFVQALELPHLCAWIGYYLSLLQNTDPGPEPWILKLKAALSQTAG